ncbi:MAG: ATP-binding protein [Flavobacteriales bacterium]|jgi:signal transduction histidine kinase
MKATIREINNSFEGYERLIALYVKLKSVYFEQIEVEIEGWFAANMSSALGCILDLISDNINMIKVNASYGWTSRILKKNEFLSYYGQIIETDNHHTTIRYQKLTADDGRSFKEYVIEELLERTELPIMTNGVKEKMAEGIYEIFVNAQIHSESTNIYTCGQYFPKDKKIEFTIVDNGIGFKEKVNRRFGTDLSAIQAIKWATKDKNTTKEEVTGGIGLALLKEFVEMNKGKMQIVSSNGFYEFSAKGETVVAFSDEFPGTIVNLQFRTDDMSSYKLVSENIPKPEDIF